MDNAGTLTASIVGLAPKKRDWSIKSWLKGHDLGDRGPDGFRHFLEGRIRPAAWMNSHKSAGSEILPYIGYCWSVPLATRPRER